MSQEGSQQSPSGMRLMAPVQSGKLQIYFNKVHILSIGFFSHYQLRCKQGDVEFPNITLNIGENVNLRARFNIEGDDSISSGENGRGLEYDIDPRLSNEENDTANVADVYLCQARIVFTIPGNDIEQFPTPASETFKIATESLIVQNSLEVYPFFVIFSLYD